MKQSPNSRNAGLSARSTLWLQARQRDANTYKAKLEYDIRLRFIRLLSERLQFTEAHALSLSAWQLFSNVLVEDYTFYADAIELYLLQGRIPIETELTTLVDYLKHGI